MTRAEDRRITRAANLETALIAQIHDTYADTYGLDGVDVDIHGDAAIIDVDIILPDAMVRMSRLDGVPHQHMVGLALRSPEPYGRWSFTACTDTELGALLATGQHRHRDLAALGTQFRTELFDTITATLDTHAPQRAGHDRLEIDPEWLPEEMRPTVLDVHHLPGTVVVTTDFAGLRVDVQRLDSHPGVGEPVVYTYHAEGHRLSTEQIGTIAAGGQPTDPPRVGDEELGEITIAYLQNLADHAAQPAPP